jgi:hypothetical protein
MADRGGAGWRASRSDAATRWLVEEFTGAAGAGSASVGRPDANPYLVEWLASLAGGHGPVSRGGLRAR